MPETENPLLCSIPDTCRLTDLGRTKVYQLLDDGELLSVHIGKRRLIIRASIDAYIEKLIANTTQHVGDAGARVVARFEKPSGPAFK